MGQEDYLKKQFDRLGRVLAKILADLLGLKYTLDIDQEIKIITEFKESELGFNLREIMDLPNKGFIQQLTGEQNFNNESLEILADIFLVILEKASNQEENRIKKKMLAEKCILIWEYLEKTEAAYSMDRNLKIERIQTYLQ